MSKIGQKWANYIHEICQNWRKTTENESEWRKMAKKIRHQTFFDKTLGYFKALEEKQKSRKYQYFYWKSLFGLNQAKMYTIFYLNLFSNIGNFEIKQKIIFSKLESKKFASEITEFFIFVTFSSIEEPNFFFIFHINANIIEIVVFFFNKWRCRRFWWKKFIILLIDGNSTIFFLFICDRHKFGWLVFVQSMTFTSLKHDFLRKLWYESDDY